MPCEQDHRIWIALQSSAKTGDVELGLSMLEVRVQ
jgi:hypothetical protein